MKINNNKVISSAKKIIALIILVVLLISLSSCWDNRELDAVSIILGVGIDVIPNDDKLNYIFQLNKSFPSNGGNSSSSSNERQFYNMEAKSTGLMEAQEKIDLNLARVLFMEHNQFVLIGKDKAKKTVEDILDAFMRENFLRIEVYILVADEKAKDVMEIELPQEKVTAIGIYKLIESISKNNKTFDTKIYKFVSESNDVSLTTVAPIVGVKDEGDIKFLDIKGLAVFKDYVMVGELNSEYSRAYSWIMGNYKSATYDLHSDKMYANINIPSIKYELKTYFNEKKEPVVDIKYKITGNVGEVISQVEMDAEQLEKYIEEELKKDFTKKLYDCINYSKAINADVFGFGNKFHENNLKDWKKIEKNWEEYYKNLQVNIKTEFRIFSEGKIDDFIYFKEEESNA